MNYSLVYLVVLAIGTAVNSKRLTAGSICHSSCCTLPYYI